MPAKSASEVASAHLTSTSEKSRRIAGLTSPNAKGITDHGDVGRSPSKEKETTKQNKSPTSAMASVEVFPLDEIDEAAQTSKDNGKDEAAQTDHDKGKDALPQKDAHKQGKRKNASTPNDAQNETPLEDESTDDRESTPIKSSKKKTKSKGRGKKDEAEDPQISEDEDDEDVAPQSSDKKSHHLTKKAKNKRKNTKSKKPKQLEEESSSDDDDSTRKSKAKPKQRNSTGSTHKTAKALPPSNQKSIREKGRRSPKKRSRRSPSDVLISKTPGQDKPHLQCLIQATKNAKKCPQGAVVQVTKAIFPPTPVSPPPKHMTLRPLSIQNTHKVPMVMLCNVYVNVMSMS
jgi:hypothetical protein